MQNREIPIAKGWMPDLTKWKSRIVKANLFRLDGTIDEIRLTYPIMPMDGDAQQLAAGYIESIILTWTAHHVQIRGYQVHLGTVSVDGTEHFGISYPPEEIPLGKVFYQGQWVDPEQKQVEALDTIRNPKRPHNEH